MPYGEVPSFVASLRERPTTAARAFEFAILATARSGEAAAARWDEIDFACKVWTVPPTRTKAAREHRVPLTDRSLAILEEMKAGRTSDYLFPGRRPGRPLSGTAFEIQPTPRTASDRHSEIGRATKRTTRANLPNTPLLMSSATRPNKPTVYRTRSRGSAN
jgi:integrase